MSAIYYRDDYDRKLPKPFHMGTYRANPLALAAGAYVLGKIPQYLPRVERDGKKLVSEFSRIDSDIILDVRGKGFMIGIELGRNNKPLTTEKMMKIKHKLLNRGLIMHTCGHFGNVFRYMGALNIPDELNQKGIEIFRSVIESEGGDEE